MKLAKVINEYLTFKHAMGIKYKSESAILFSFYRYVGNVHIGNITTEQIRVYLDGNKRNSSFWTKKYITLSGLYRFSISRNYANTFPLPSYHPQISSQFTPYIYSKEELKRLLDNTSIVCGHRAYIEGFVFRALILLLYGACLRHEEALQLTMNDVNLKEGTLHIRETKFYKTRIVPLGKNLLKELNQYSLTRNEIYQHETTSPFFCFKNGRALSQSAVRYTFRRLRIQANVRRSDKTIYQPRLHDLRHTGVVHRLTAWYHNGEDFNRLLPLLSIYLGHTGLESTRHYLTLTPELLNEASLRFERFAVGGKND